MLKLLHSSSFCSISLRSASTNIWPEVRSSGPNEPVQTMAISLLHTGVLNTGLEQYSSSICFQHVTACIWMFYQISCVLAAVLQPDREALLKVHSQGQSGKDPHKSAECMERRWACRSLGVAGRTNFLQNSVGEHSYLMLEQERNSHLSNAFSLQILL